jgi:hypothetical protein
LIILATDIIVITHVTIATKLWRLAVEQAELELAQHKFEDEVRTRLAGTAIDKVELLQYGDEPEIEPGELLGRITIGLPEGADPTDKKIRQQALEALVDNADPDAVAKELKQALGVKQFSDFKVFSRGGPDGQEHGPFIELKIKPDDRSPVTALGGDQPLTAVMARVGPEDLETLDTLIAVGIASSRAEAVRWALARLRGRPAYEQLRARSREIEDLKSQF